MILKALVYSVLFMALIITAYSLYLSVSDYYTPTRIFILNETLNQDINQPSYSGLLQFYPNMRFDKRQLSYNIESSCDNKKRVNMMKAFEYLKNITGLLSFYESSNPSISILCQEAKEEPIRKYFIVGEGGPISIVNTSSFYVIQKGKIFLFYKDVECDNYNIELHELLHVFGFDHSSNINSIMYNTTECYQIVTNDIINEMKRLYSIPELPDLTFDNGKASVQQGKYLNFTVEVKNIGLKSARAMLEVYSDGKKFYEYDLGDMDYGEGKMVWGITSLPSRKIDKIEFMLVNGEELNKENNIISLFPAS